MPKINSDFTVRYNTGLDLTGAVTTDLIYRKPNSTTEVNIGGAVYSTSYIEADVPVASNDTAGKWLFRSYIVMATGEIINGPVVFINVEELWEPWE